MALHELGKSFQGMFAACHDGVRLLSETAAKVAAKLANSPFDRGPRQRPGLECSPGAAECGTGAPLERHQAQSRRRRTRCIARAARVRVPIPRQVVREPESRERAAETRLSLDCAACGSSWTEFLDVAAFVWAEFEAAARRLLIDVADLARAFGWSEQEILNLSEIRRGAYLALARGA